MKKLSFIIILILMLSLTMILFCNSGNTTDNNNTSNNKNEDNDQIALQNKPIDVSDSNNEFAMDIFKSIEQEMRAGAESDTENMFISPMSIFVALAMTDNGAGGPLREGISKTLHLMGYDLNKVNAGVKKMIDILEEKGRNIDLLIANSIWQQQNFPVLESFKETLIQFYDAYIETVNFGDPKTKDIINAWISDNTNDLIKDMIDNTNPDDVMYLVNAIYFYGQWLRKFDKDLTGDATFHLLNGETKDVPMMNNDGDYLYYSGKDFNAIRLSYGKLKDDLDEEEMMELLFKNKEYVSMYILLPNKRSDIYQLIDNLDNRQLDMMFKDMRPKNLRISLPKFKIEFGGDYKEILDNLVSLGMPTSNDFTNMTSSPQGLFISKVLHQAVVEVNEEGTEAAAATVVEIGRGGMTANEFIANEPFLFIIRDDKTGAILFMGILKDPSQS